VTAVATPRRRSERLASLAAAGGFLGPNLVLVALFALGPLVAALVISLQEVDSLGARRFVGFDNYVTLVTDPVFWQSVGVTVVFTVLTVPVGMALGLAIAVLFDGVLPLRALWRSIVFLPLVVSGVATGVLGAWFFDQNAGFVNDLLVTLGLPRVDWQSGGVAALASIVLVTLWQRVGFDMLIYLAGLQGIDRGVQEAASVDGASGWQRFRLVTFPMLGPSTFFLLVMNLIYSFQVFDTVWAMTRGGPGYSTTTLVSYAYRAAFDPQGPGALGYGAAIGVAITVLTLAFTAMRWKSVARAERDES
jgi:multiple sugar transport system permease protein